MMMTPTTATVAGTLTTRPSLRTVLVIAGESFQMDAEMYVLCRREGTVDCHRRARQLLPGDRVAFRAVAKVEADGTGGGERVVEGVVEACGYAKERLLESHPHASQVGG